MTSDESFLQKDALELEHFLVQQARGDRAPRGSRERVLASLASVPLAAGVVTSAKVAWGAGAAAKATPWFVTKWVVIGMTATLTAFTAAQGVRDAFNARETEPVELEQAPPRLRLGSPPGAERASPSRPEPASVAATPAGSPEATGLPNAPAGAAETGAADSSSVRLPLPSATGFTDTEGNTEQLTREVARLRHARASLASGSAAAALEALNRYEREFPSGALRAEAAALRIEAVATLGNRALARSLAAEFLTRFPASPLAARVQTIAGLAAQGKKP